MGTEATNWKDRIIYDEQGSCVAPPPWLSEAYTQFEAVVSRKGYPCHFGQAALKSGDVYVSYCSRSDLSRLPGVMRRFTRHAFEHSARRVNIALFLEPEALAPTPETFTKTCWEVLQYLLDGDSAVEAPESVRSPDDPLWEFPFAGMLYFVVGMSPTYVRRKSRNVGNTIALLFQPRLVFDDELGHGVKEQARREIRARLRRWDEVDVHPDLGVYGEERNREWKQYVLPDDSEPVVGQCPLRMHKAAKQAVAFVIKKEDFAMERLPGAQEFRQEESVIREFTGHISEFMKRCRFFLQWRVGMVSKRDAVEFLTAFDQLVGSFPGLIAAGISRQGEGGRVVLAKNLFEECGSGDRQQTHHAIYRRYLHSIGVDWQGSDLHQPTADWRGRLLERTLQADAGEVTGLIAAGEFLAQPALTQIYEVLKPIFPGADVEYFTKHLEIETKHVEEIAELIAVGCAEGANLTAVERGFAFALERWDEWFASVLASLMLGDMPEQNGKEYVGGLA